MRLGRSLTQGEPLCIQIEIETYNVLLGFIFVRGYQQSLMLVEETLEDP